ncbi:GntR family transcriptional regulator [Arthrobacter sp. AET 35A]|uniref:GntR family transcriptional regulator n=1 Tax=Arthrobacter sp. AET 35A TaxID=2292643 RepID=UPI00177AABEC|nr:GntR family transcriptional regulator [Arthrobacter sp. AET 35A]MBE0011304.1 GntR family transcriptional regulator [Arthrobacter sp. AET 35A]
MSDLTDSGRVDGGAIFRVLRSEILSGVHPPGTPLREVGLSERFGVSRTPIREALSRLQHERLLERATRGLQVPQIDPQEVVQIYDLRVMLEQEAAGQAAASRTVSDIMRLEGLVERDRELDSPDDQTRIRCNVEFHTAVSTAAHNRVLQDLLERLSTHLINTPRSTLSVGNRWEDALDEHEALVKAVVDQRADDARQIARQHMETARALRLELLRTAAKAE